jgi:hypothetical protein
LKFILFFIVFLTDNFLFILSVFVFYFLMTRLECIQFFKNSVAWGGAPSHLSRTLLLFFYVPSIYVPCHPNRTLFSIFLNVFKVRNFLSVSVTFIRYFCLFYFSFIFPTGTSHPLLGASLNTQCDLKYPAWLSYDYN